MESGSRTPLPLPLPKCVIDISVTASILTKDDLINEAAARKRTILDSRPEKIDLLERKILQLEIEATALWREKDKASDKRRSSIQKEISNLKEELALLNAKWHAERDRAEELNEKLATLDAKAAATKRAGGYEKAADLKQGAISDLKGHLMKVENEEEKERSKQITIVRASQQKILQRSSHAGPVSQLPNSIEQNGTSC
jgi:ATP-dependent Clp protease ATP-binding subunit ClpA